MVQISPLTFPPDINEYMASMFPYQEHDFILFLKQIEERGFAVCHWEQGLGKTLVSIRLADAIAARRVLVLCPAIARLSWTDESEKWGIVDREIILIRGSADVRKLDKAPDKPLLVICTYDLCRNDRLRHKLRDFGFDFAILDEFQQVRSPTAKRTGAVYGIGEGVLTKIPRLIIMSGTPIVSWPMDLWTHLKRFGPARILGPDGKPMSAHQFKYRYHVVKLQSLPNTDKKLEKIIRVKDLDDLKRRTQGWAVRRRKVEVLKDLPPISTRTWPVEGDAKSKKILMDGLKDELPPHIYSALANAKTDADMEVAMRMIAQSSAHVAKVQRLSGTAKAAPVARALAEELDESTYKIGVFAWNIDVVETLHAQLRRFHSVVITGATSHSQRREAVDRFMHGDSRVFIGQIQACGTALTLTAASRVVFVQLSWTPGDNAQAAARFHRIGQKEPVDVRVAYLSGTVDDGFSRVLTKKSRAANILIEN